jgi:hypothetical protein
MIKSCALLCLGLVAGDFFGFGLGLGRRLSLLVFDNGDLGKKNKSCAGDFFIGLPPDAGRPSYRHFLFSAVTLLSGQNSYRSCKESNNHFYCNRLYLDVPMTLLSRESL